MSTAALAADVMSESWRKRRFVDPRFDEGTLVDPKGTSPRQRVRGPAIIRISLH